MGIEESSTYQEILQKGEARGEARGLTRGALEEARRLLQTLGTERLGVPDHHVKSVLVGCVDVAEIERLVVKLLRVNSWEELLDLPRS